MIGYQYKLNDNQQLNETLSSFQLPTISYTTIESDGFGQQASIVKITC